MGGQKKLLMAALPVFLMVLALPVYLFLSSSSQENRSRASEKKAVNDCLTGKDKDSNGVPCNADKTKASEQGCLNGAPDCPVDTPTVTIVPTTGSANNNASGSAGKGQVTIAVTLKLHGIGSSGDNVAPQSKGNENPLHPQRNVEVTVLDTTGRDLSVATGSVQYNSATGTFQGSITLGADIKRGEYLLKVKTDQYLRRLIPNVQTLRNNAINNLPVLELIAGDITNDNAINLSDFNILIACYSKVCAEDKKRAADLNDDGVVNQYDFNLFLREQAVKAGD